MALAQVSYEVASANVVNVGIEKKRESRQSCQVSVVDALHTFG